MVVLFEWMFDVVYLDFGKLVDKVPGLKAIDKAALSSFGNKRQTMKIRGCFCKRKHMPCGPLQESDSRPRLFVMNWPLDVKIDAKKIDQLKIDGSLDELERWAE